MGAVCSLLGWKVDRIPEEIEWKSRRARVVVVATRKRRNEVSSRCSGSRPTLRFSERAARLRAREYHRVSRMHGDIFARRFRFFSSSYSSLHLHRRFFPPLCPFSTKPAKFRVAAAPIRFVAVGKLKFLTTISPVMHSYMYI